MLTIFSTAKPFRGHSGVIQRNALRSWTLLHPDVEVILFGDDEGAAEVCSEFGIRHEPVVRRNENGTKYLNYIFDRAQQIARHNVLCYSNCDIMLMADFRRAAEQVSASHSSFLMIGQRWDTDVTEAWNFDQPDWDRRLRHVALSQGKRKGPSWVDYFCFSRGLYHGMMPPFFIGRFGWDPWLTWFARKTGATLVDATKDVLAVHQNHGYAHLGTGPAASRAKAEATYNWGLGTTAAWHYYTVDNATVRVVNGALRTNRLAWFAPLKARLMRVARALWFGSLSVTLPVRHRLGLRRRFT